MEVERGEIGRKGGKVRNRRKWRKGRKRKKSTGLGVRGLGSEKRGGSGEGI